MNAKFLFNSTKEFNLAVSALTVEATSPYITDANDLVIETDNEAELVEIFEANNLYRYEIELSTDDDRMYPGEEMDGDFDSGMASAGHGTGEDYGEFDERC